MRSITEGGGGVEAHMVIMGLLYGLTPDLLILKTVK